MIGFQYDKQEPVSAANRNFSKKAQYIYNTSINTHAGSSRTPGGGFSYRRVRQSLRRWVVLPETALPA